METYQTEEEQLSAIKAFVAKNGTLLLTGVVVAIAAILGFQAFQAKQQAAKETASQYYNTMMQQLSNLATADASLSDSQQLNFDNAYQQLITEHADSVYAVYANFLQAKQAVNSKQLGNAKQYLQWIINANTDQQLTALAELRMAQVLYAQSDFEAALSLAAKQSEPFKAEYMQLQGDILQAQGDSSAALALYLQAKLLAANSDPMLELKVQSLSPVDQTKLAPQAE